MKKIFQTILFPVMAVFFFSACPDLDRAAAVDEREDCIVHFSGGFHFQMMSNHELVGSDQEFPFEIRPNRIQFAFSDLNEDFMHVQLIMKTFPQLVIDANRLGDFGIDEFIIERASLEPVNGFLNKNTGKLFFNRVPLELNIPAIGDQIDFPELVFTTEDSAIVGLEGDIRFSGSRLTENNAITLATTALYPNDGLSGDSLGGHAVGMSLEGRFNQDPRVVCASDLNEDEAPHFEQQFKQ